MLVCVHVTMHLPYLFSHCRAQPAHEAHWANQVDVYICLPLVWITCTPNTASQCRQPELVNMLADAASSAD